MVFACCFGGSSGNDSDSENEKLAAAAEARARHARIARIYEESSQAADSIIVAPPPCYADIAHDRPVLPAGMMMDEKRSLAVLSSQQQPVEQRRQHTGGDGEQAQQLHTPMPDARRFSVSSGSSVVSVPSTRLSDLTSLHTTRNTRTRQRRRRTSHGSNGQQVSRAEDADESGSENNDSWSENGTIYYYDGSSSLIDRDSAPPSYYAGSERSFNMNAAMSPVLGPVITFNTGVGVGIQGYQSPAPMIPPGSAQHPVMHMGWLESLTLNAEMERRGR